MEDIVAAARAANIDDFISNLPDGYDTMVRSSRLPVGLYVSLNSYLPTNHIYSTRNDPRTN